MRPESTSTILRRDLTETAQEFDAEGAAARFIAPVAAPLVIVPDQAATYPVMNRENFKKVDDTNRGADGAYNRITGEFGTGSYACDEHGLETVLDDRRAARYRTWMSFEQAMTRVLRYRMLMAWERRVAALYAALGLSNHNVTTAWSDKANAVPLSADFPAAFNALEDACGCGRNELTLIIPRADYAELLETAEVRNRMLYTYPGVQPAQLAAAQLASMLEIRAVKIARSSYDATVEGETESMSQVWAAGVAYVALLAAPNAPMDSPSAARTIIWPGDGATEIPVVETYREEKVRGDVLRVRDDSDEVATAEADLMAYQITNT